VELFTDFILHKEAIDIIFSPILPLFFEICNNKINNNMSFTKDPTLVETAAVPKLLVRLV
jgi:hypothetical protein